jgi:hypothetical protein
MNFVKEMMIEGCPECGGDNMDVDGCGVKCVDCGHHRCFVGNE